MLDFFGKFISQRLKNHHVLRFWAEYSRMQFSCWNVEKLTVGTGSSGKFKVDKWVPHILESLNGGSHPLMRTRSFAFRSAYPVASRNEFKERHHQTEPCFWVAASWIFSESFIPQTVNHQFQKINMFWDFRWNGSAVELSWRSTNEVTERQSMFRLDDTVATYLNEFWSANGAPVSSSKNRKVLGVRGECIRKEFLCCWTMLDDWLLRHHDGTRSCFGVDRGVEQFQNCTKHAWKQNASVSSENTITSVDHRIESSSRAAVRVKHKTC